MRVHRIKEKFTEVYDKEADSLFRYCLLRVNDKEKAMDITQDVFTELWKQYNSGEKIINERAYLFTLARNRIIDWYRKKKSESLDVILDEEADRSIDISDERLHKSIVHSAEANMVLREIENLDPSYREVLFLRFSQDLSPKEIAEIMGSTANNVSVQITRGLEKLREKFHTKK